MSILRVDNFGPSAGGTTYSAGGIAKAWVNFNGTGTVTARDSLNLSSLTDVGTGNYTVHFSSNLANNTYGFLTTSIYQLEVLHTPSTSSLSFGTQYVSDTAGGSTSQDTPSTNAAIHGDLA